MNLVENQMSKKLKALKNNRGSEYLFNEFKQLCYENGSQRQLTTPFTP